MGEVFGTPYDLFTAENPPQWKHGYDGSQPLEPAGMTNLPSKGPQPVHMVQKIYDGTVAEIYNGIGPDCGAQLLAQAEYLHVFAGRQINP